MNARIRLLLLLGRLVPDDVIGAPERRGLFMLFMGVALSISALPVIAKTLLDLAHNQHAGVRRQQPAVELSDDLLGPDT